MSKFTTVRGVRNTKQVVHLFQNRRTLWQMLKDVFNGRYRMSFLTKVIMAASVLYVLFPFDVISDLIPFFGWLDDGFVIFLLVRRLLSETHRYTRFKVMERKRY